MTHRRWPEGDGADYVPSTVLQFGERAFHANDRRIQVDVRSAKPVTYLIEVLLGERCLARH
jgi:hypothetical protein